MTPEERAAYEEEHVREQRREQRKERMLKSTITAYGGANKLAALRGVSAIALRRCLCGVSGE